MRSVIFCFPVFLILCFLVSGLLAQQNVDFCPVNPQEQTIRASTPGEEAPPSPKVYTVPRKQVLVELATATW